MVEIWTLRLKYINLNVPKNIQRLQYRHHEAAKTSHFSVFDGFYYITFIDVCRVTTPADVEVVNEQLNCNLAAS